jgi:DNA-binding transcriptional LysR family regulator
MGITELPAILWEPHASLVRILPKWALGDVTLNLLFASDRLLSRAVRAVIDAMTTTTTRASDWVLDQPIK